MAITAEETTEIQVDVQAVAPGKYWIGVLAQPVDSELVKTQLGISMVWSWSVWCPTVQRIKPG